MQQSGQDDLRRKRQRRRDGPRRERAVIRTVRHTAGQVAAKASCKTSDAPGDRAGTVAGGDPPYLLAVIFEAFRIADGVLLLHVGGATAVLEVIARLTAHVGILDAAEVYPDMRQLVHEQRPAVQKFVSVQLLPAIRRRPGAITPRGECMRRRAQAEHIENQGFVVSLPSVLLETGLRLPPV